MGSAAPFAQLLCAAAVFCCALTAVSKSAAEEWISDLDPPPASRQVSELGDGRCLYWHDPFDVGDRVFYQDFISPLWYASAEYQPLFRDQNGSLAAQPLVPGGTLAVGTGGFDSEFESGGRILIGRSIGDGHRLEFSWLGSFDWSDTTAASTTGETASISFDSTLNSGEINLRHRVCLYQDIPNYGWPMEFSTLLGLRYMRVDEGLRYSGQTVATTSQAMVDIDNKMFGVQIGALAQFLFYDSGWIDLEIKGGILSNEIALDSVYTVTPGATSTFPGGENRTSFLADLSVVLNYQCTSTCTLRLGYNAIWVNGLALGSQNTSTDPTQPPLNVEHSGEVIYHGPMIGLVIAR